MTIRHNGPSVLHERDEPEELPVSLAQGTASHFRTKLVFRALNMTTGQGTLDEPAHQGVEMAMGGNWFTVFRTDEENVGWLYQELRDGRLRQGWGSPGLGLRTAHGRRVEKAQWEAEYNARWGEAPSSKRFAILSRMLDFLDGHVVVVPKMPEITQFTIVRVRGGYCFETAGDLEDFRHIVDIHRDSVRTFGCRANNDAFLISGLFARANHRSAVTLCHSNEHVGAAQRLLQREGDSTNRPQMELSQAAISDAFKSAAVALQNKVADWNGSRFEEAVRQAFRDQGYTIKDHRRFDRQGADVDILVSPPASLYGLFLPSEIAVQVKWKQGVDEDDEESVRQIVKWAEWVGSDAVKYVISSASGFTDCAQELAKENDVVLIGGLQAMCFLLGVPDQYRDDWD